MRTRRAFSITMFVNIIYRYYLCLVEKCRTPYGVHAVLISCAIIVLNYVIIAYYSRASRNYTVREDRRVNAAVDEYSV